MIRPIKSCQNWRLQTYMVFCGSEALAALRQAELLRRPYDLVVLDVLLPDTDDYHLKADILKDAALSQPPIFVFISAMQLSKPDVDQVIHVALKDTLFLEKPIGNARLRRAIAKALSIEQGCDAAEWDQLRQHKQVPDFFNLRVLVADDNPVNRMLINGQLQKMNAVFRWVENGRQAVALFQRSYQNGQPFDLILMDCEMPVLNGYEAAIAIRKWEGGLQEPGKVYIIALTALLTPAVQQQARAVGMNEFVGKPISLDLLAQTLTAYFPPRKNS